MVRSRRGHGGRRARKRASRRGLTLLEVMLAVIVIALTFIPLLSVSSKALRVVQHAKEYETARNLLEQLKKSEPLQLDEVDGDDRETGNFDGDNRNYRWERELTQVGEESDQLYLVVTRVTWERRRGRKDGKEEVFEYLHLPTARKRGWIDEMAADD